MTESLVNYVFVDYGDCCHWKGRQCVEVNLKAIKHYYTSMWLFYITCHLIGLESHVFERQNVVSYFIWFEFIKEKRYNNKNKQTNKQSRRYCFRTSRKSIRNRRIMHYHMLFGIIKLLLHECLRNMKIYSTKKNHISQYVYNHILLEF